jgi:hypothetical protein
VAPTTATFISCILKIKKASPLCGKALDILAYKKIRPYPASGSTS